MSANNTQVAGNHYKSLAIEPWEIVEKNGLNFWEGNVLKYLLRHRKKNGVQDLKKARHYLDKLIEIEEAKTPTLSVTSEKGFTPVTD